MEYTDEQIKEIFNTSNTQREVLDKLGCKPNGSGWRLFHKLAKQINFDLTLYKTFKCGQSKEQYDQNPKFCKYCGKRLTYEQRRNLFCSHSCSSKFNNPYHTKNKNIKKYCLNCGSLLPQSKITNKFCCHECSTEYRYNNLIERWLNGENFSKCGHQIPTFIKRYLMNIHNNKCEKCNWGEEHPITHNVPLAVHHIDGDCTNNRIENLQLLCPNCHSLTENFGSLNKNSKRFHRKKISKSEII